MHTAPEWGFTTAKIPAGRPAYEEMLRQLQRTPPSTYFDPTDPWSQYVELQVQAFLQQLALWVSQRSGPPLPSRPHPGRTRPQQERQHEEQVPPQPQQECQPEKQAPLQSQQYPQQQEQAPLQPQQKPQRFQQELIQLQPQQEQAPQQEQEPQHQVLALPRPFKTP